MDESVFLNPARVVRAAKVGEGMRVADLGAGSGFFTRAAAREVGPGGVVWAVDIQQGILSRIKNLAAAEGLHNVEVVHGDIEHLGGTHLPAATFDFCLVTNVLFTLEDKENLAAEVYRLLRQGGSALVVDWAGSFGGLGPHPSHVYTEGLAHDLFVRHGCTYGERVPAGPYHWGFVVRKKS